MGLKDGCALGFDENCPVGWELARLLGFAMGCEDGTALDRLLGTALGCIVDDPPLGCADGCATAIADGCAVSAKLSIAEGVELG